MRTNFNNKLISILCWLPLAICLVISFLYFASGKTISAEEIISYAPKNILLATGFIMLAYALKSMTIFFPVIVLRIAVGFMFPTAYALLVNMLGMVVELTVPYYIGRVSGPNTIGKLKNKYPKFALIANSGNKNEIYISFFLRIVSFLPSDAVSMYFGSKNTSYKKYLLGSLIGVAPGVITATLIGTNITDPASPMFVFSLVFTIALSIASLVFFEVFRRKRAFAEKAVVCEKCEENNDLAQY